MKWREQGEGRKESGKDGRENVEKTWDRIR